MDAVWFEMYWLHFNELKDETLGGHSNIICAIRIVLLINSCEWNNLNN